MARPRPSLARHVALADDVDVVFVSPGRRHPVGREKHETRAADEARVWFVAPTRDGLRGKGRNRHRRRRRERFVAVGPDPPSD